MTRRCGFTLMELIVVIAIMGVATTLVMTMMFRISDVWRQVSVRTQLNSRATSAFRSCAADIMGVQSAGVKFAVVQRDAREAAKSADDRLVISQSQPGAPPSQIVYQIDRKDDANVLVRSEARLGVTAANAQTVARDVVGMCVEFIGRESGAMWQREWSRPDPPGAVRISLTMADPAQPSSPIVRKMVFPVFVN